MSDEAERSEEGSLSTSEGASLHRPVPAAFEWDVRELHKTLSIVYTLLDKLSAQTDEAQRRSTQQVLAKTLRVWKALLTRFTDKLATHSATSASAPAPAHDLEQQQLQASVDEAKRLREERDLLRWEKGQLEAQLTSNSLLQSQSQSQSPAPVPAQPDYAVLHRVAVDENAYLRSYNEQLQVESAATSQRYAKSKEDTERMRRQLHDASDELARLRRELQLHHQHQQHQQQQQQHQQAQAQDHSQTSQPHIQSQPQPQPQAHAPTSGSSSPLSTSFSQTPARLLTPQRPSEFHASSPTSTSTSTATTSHIQSQISSPSVRSGRPVLSRARSAREHEVITQVAQVAQAVSPKDTSPSISPRSHPSSHSHSYLPSHPETPISIPTSTSTSSERPSHVTPSSSALSRVLPADVRAQIALRAEVTEKAFERNYATRRMRAQAGGQGQGQGLGSGEQGQGQGRRRPTLTELTRTKFADEQDPLRYVEEEKVRVEAMRLRNKLAQNRVAAMDDDATTRSLSRLRERLRVHALELDALRRRFSTLLEFKEGLETRLVNAGSGALVLAVLATRSGEVSTRHAAKSKDKDKDKDRERERERDKEKEWKRRYAVLSEHCLYVFDDDDRHRLMFKFPVRLTQFGASESSTSASPSSPPSASASDFYALTPSAAVGSAEREGLVFHCESGEDARAWVRHLLDASAATRDPLARFGLTQRESLVAALRAHEYALPMALLFFAGKKDEKASVSATQALLDVFEGQGDALDFVRFVIDAEIERTTSERELLRENNAHSRVLTKYAQRYGTAYLRDTLAQTLRELGQEDKDMECFAARLGGDNAKATAQAAANRVHVASAVQRLLDAVVASRDTLPAELRVLAHHLWLAIKSRFPSASPAQIGCFFFLRFLCPAIAVPHAAGILDTPPPPRLSRGLVLVTKILQNMSNDVKFGQKEPDMVPFNTVMAQNMSRFTAFLTAIAAYVPDPTPARLGADYGVVQLRSEIVSYLTKLEPVLYMINV